MREGGFAGGSAAGDADEEGRGAGDAGVGGGCWG